MKKTLLIGNFGAHNLGDELILDSALGKFGAENCVVMTVDKRFSRKFAEKRFKAMPPFPTGMRSFLQFIFSAKYRKALFRYRDDIDEVVFAGGGLFAIRTKAFFLWWIISLWVKFVFKGRPVDWVYQGFDMPRDFAERFFLKSAIKGARRISIRDQQSCEVYRSLFEGVTCDVQKDRVEMGLHLGLLGPHDKPRKKILLFNAIYKVAPEELKRVEDYADARDLEVIFVHFSPHDVKHLSKDFHGKHIFPKTKTELLDLFSTASVVVGERFHAVVLGYHFCKKNTFLFREPYSQKVSNFCANEGVKILE